MTRRIKLTVAYDGTDFCGWAAQPGLRTVQGTLTETVRQVSGEACEIIGASRTDSGAHARGQVVHYDSTVALPIEKWVGALNKRLPPDLRAVQARTVPNRFNARFSATDRWYRYSIAKADDDPFLLRYAFGQRRILDVGAMQEAAAMLTGKHDFRSFTEELERHVENTVRELFSITVTERADRIDVDIVGTAFLRGMMRRISGCLYEVGRNARPLSDVKRLLDQQPGLQLPVVLPAHGLTLMRVRYGRWPVDNRTGNDENGF